VSTLARTATPPSPEVPRNRVWIRLALLLLLGLALGLRIVPAWSLLIPEEGGPPRPVDTDALFHLRHSIHVAENFPDLRRWEDVARYPEFERNDASGLWDLALGTTGRLVALVTGLPPADATAWVAFFAPPLLFALTLLLAFQLLQRLGGSALALVPIGWAVLLPGDTFTRTAAGYCDHHIVEMLVAVWAPLAWIRLLSTESDRAHPWWRPAWTAAAPLIVLHFSWLGAPLHLLLLVLTAGLLTLLAPAAGHDPRLPARACMRLLLAHGLISAAAGLLFPNAILRTSLHLGSLAGIAAALVAFPATAALLAAAQRRWPGRGALITLSALVACFVLAATIWFASPLARRAVEFGLSQKPATVFEHPPVTWRLFFALGGATCALALAAPAILLITGAWRSLATVSALTFALLHIALWARTSDYIYHVALQSALAAGVTLVTVRARYPRIAWSLAIACSLLILWGVGPGRWSYPLVSRQQNASEAIRVQHEGWTQTTAWWRTVPPPPPPPPDTAPVPDALVPPRGAIGVLGDWASGNIVNTYTPWPVVNSRYPDAEGLQPLFALSEAEALRSPLRGSTVEQSVRWLVIEPRTFGDYFFAHLATLNRPADAFQIPHQLKTSARDFAVRALGGDYERLLGRRLLTGDGTDLAHFRLVFESPRQVALRHLFQPAGGVWLLQSDRIPPNALETARATLARPSWQEGARIGYRGELHPSVKIFERVRGATLRGRADPGALVRLRLGATARPSGRALALSWSTHADDSGTWHITVPYATADLPAWNTVIPDPAGYVVEIQTPPTSLRLTPPRPRRISVPESAIQSGATLELSPEP
jgi:hypothetical protein